jgi:hypothetical protein
MKTRFLVALAALAFVRADFGDFVDPTYDCPALTTCVQVCVADVNDCPPEMLCNSTETLCADGSCATECDPSLETPCAYDCAPVACHKVVDYYDACFDKYAAEYAFESQCGEEESAAHVFQWNEAVFVFLYCWIAFVTVLILAWSFFNQKMRPVAGSTVWLEDGEVSKTLTGYKTGIVGDFVYAMTLLTLLGFQILLATTTALYYVQQEAITRWRMIFEDEEQVLLAFEIVWCVGFFWTFALKWPSSIRSLCLRRCILGEATSVAVFVPDEERKDLKPSTKCISLIKLFLANMSCVIDGFMAFLFSDTPRTKLNGSFLHCRVKRDEDGSRYFYFNFRRYNLNEETGVYVPGGK